MTAYNPAVFGRSLHTHRLKLGWSASLLCELYAEFVDREDSPPGPTYIYHIEAGTALVGQERRAVLASLVGLPLVDLTELGSSTPLDIDEYTQTLASYCDKWRAGPLKQERVTIEERANQLEAAASQACGAEKRRLLELFGFYQIFLAFAWGGQPRTIASALLSSTIEIAKEEKLSALHVYARICRAGIHMGRFESTLDREALQDALRDYHEAAEEQDHLPLLYAGLLHVGKGLLDAYTACDKKAFTAALHEITKGSNHIGEAIEDQRITARLDEEYCMLARARAYLHAPMGNAKMGLAQLQELERRNPESCGKRRLVQRHQLFAEALLATDDYPMAAAYLEAAVENAWKDCIEGLVLLHARLKNTSYGSAPDVGRLAVKLHQIKYPKLFP